MVMAVALLQAPHAYAGDAAAAEALFAKAKQLMADGQIDEACATFEESMKLDPGVGTKYQLGRCYEQQGRSASAWSAYLEAASMARAAGQADRAEAAKRKADALKPTLSTLTIQTAKDAPDGLTVTIRDTAYGNATFGTAIPFDPGTHDVVAAAKGFRSWQSDVTVPKDASGVSLAIPTLLPAPKEVVAPVPGPTAEVDPTLFWVGVTTLGVGVVTAGIGVGWFAVEVPGHTVDGSCTTVEGVETCDVIPGDTVPGIGMMIGGGVAAGLGAVLMAVSDGPGGGSSDNTAMRIVPLIGPGMLGVRGTF